jgi:hypothetical protein
VVCFAKTFESKPIAQRSGAILAANYQTGASTMTEKKWSQDVTEHSDAMDLEDSVFTKDDPKEIALSLKRSAEHSKRRKGTPLQSAMSMLTFYINRAGDNLPKKQRDVLEKAKDELHAAFHSHSTDC